MSNLKNKLKIVRHAASYQKLKIASKYRVVKVLKEYDNEEDATDDLIRLLTNDITEDELLRDWKSNI